MLATTKRYTQTMPVATRAKIAAEAVELKKTNPGDWLSILQQKYIPIEIKEWAADMTDDEKAKHKQARREIDNAKRRISNMANDANNLAGMEDMPLKTLRRPGAGPPPLGASIDVALLHFYNYVTKTAESLCPRSLLVKKLEQLAEAARGSGAPDVANAYGGDGSGPVKETWVNGLVRRWMERHSLKVRVVNKRQKLTVAEELLRVHTFFRNLTRIRAAYDPVAIQLDCFDHAPFYRRLGGAKTVAEENADTTFPAEKPGDRHTRFTVAVPGASDKSRLAPTIMFKAVDGQRTKDYERVMTVAKNSVFIQYSKSASFDQESTIRLLDNQYSTPRMYDFVNQIPRVLVIDQFRGQVTSKCVQRAMALGKIVLVIPGGLTGLLQPADRHQIRVMKSFYRQREDARLLSILKAKPNAIPQMSRQDVVQCVAKSWDDMVSDPNYAAAMKKVFASTGLTAPTDGSEDHLIAKDILTILNDKRGSSWEGKGCDFFEWRSHYLSTLPPPPRRANLQDLAACLENPFSVAERERFWSVYLDQDQAWDSNVDGDVVQGDDQQEMGVLVDEDQPPKGPDPAASSDPTEGEACQPPAGHPREVSHTALKEIYGVHKVRDSGDPTGEKHGNRKRTVAINEAISKLEALKNEEPGKVRKAEVEMLREISMMLSTPFLAAGVRGLVQKERKFLSRADEAFVADIEDKVSASETAEMLAEADEEEKARVVWRQEMNRAEAALELTKKRAHKPKAPKSNEGPENPQKRGRKAKYATDEERKMAKKAQRKKARDAKKQGSPKPSADRYPDALVALDAGPEEESRPSCDAMVLRGTQLGDDNSDSSGPSDMDVSDST